MLVQNAHKANSVVGEDRSHLFYIRPALSPAHYLVIILLSTAPFLLASLPFVHSFRFVLFSAPLPPFVSAALPVSLCVMLSPPRIINNPSLPLLSIAVGGEDV